MRDNIKVLIGLLIVVIFVIAMVAIWKIGYREKNIVVPLRTEIEKAIKVKNVENKILKMEKVYVLFGGGAGVGAAIGAPQVTASSAEQFVELVPENEPIYVALEAPTLKIENIGRKSRDKRFILKKVYMAFIENRAGIVVYEDSYAYKEKGHTFWLKDYSWEKAAFHWDNKEALLGTILALVVIAVCVGLPAATIIAMQK